MIRYNTENTVPIVAPGWSTSSSSSTTQFLLQHRCRRIVQKKLHFRPAITRSQRASSPARRDLVPSKETENKNKIKDTDQPRRNFLRDLHEWLEDFTENLVDERGPLTNAPANSSRESETAAPKKSGFGKIQYLHSVPERPELRNT